MVFSCFQGYKKTKLGSNGFKVFLNICKIVHRIHVSFNKWQYFLQKYCIFYCLWKQVSFLSLPSIDVNSIVSP